LQGKKQHDNVSEKIKNLAAAYGAIGIKKNRTYKTRKNSVPKELINGNNRN
jgi:hypothetical protein